MAVFSGFVSVSPRNDRVHREMKPFVEVDGGSVTVRLPYRIDPKPYWLFIATKPLAKDRQEFRDFLWSRGTPQAGSNRSDIVLYRLITESSGDIVGDAIVLHLPLEIAARAYLYHDYPSLVMGGGYYYTVDIPSYLPGLEQKFWGLVDIVIDEARKRLN
jgi:hypothetical protein